MTIRVFPSTLPGEPLEHHAHAGTFGEWLRANVPGYQPGPRQPIAALAAGRRVPPAEWDALTGDVDVLVTAQGGVLGFVSDVVTGLFGWLAPKAKVPSSREAKEISYADVRANEARLGEVIPEIAGHVRRFPDYLVPPHRYFLNAREQWVELFLCIGLGEFEIVTSTVRIGETSLLSLGDDAEFEVLAPGADVSADTRSDWWHSAPEVGGSGMGQAGLELKATYEVEPLSTASSFLFGASDVTIPTGAGEFPDGWVAGMLVRIEQYRDYEVSDGGSSADVIAGDLGDLEPFVGMVIEIAGENAGTYVIATYTPADSDSPDEITLAYPDSDASPVTGLVTGARRMAIGFDGLRYRLTAASTSAIAVERLDDAGDVAAWAGWDELETWDADIRLDPSNTEGDWSGPFAACPPGELTDTLEVDFVFPGGLQRTDKSGDQHGLSVTVEVQWRDLELAGSWSSMLFEYSDNTTDQLAFTETLELGGTMRPEVRARRTEAQSTLSRISDDAQWFALRALLEAPDSYAGVTTLAVRLRSGDRLAAQSENLISVECTRKLATLDGDAFGVTESATRSISAFVRYVAASIGYTDEQLDLDELARLDAIWTERGDFYDWVHDESTVRDVLNQVLRAGMAELTVDGGRIRPVRDEARETVEDVYDPQNMTEPLRRTVQTIRPDDADGVDVEYMDGTSWTRAVVECRLPGDTGFKVDKLTLDGVTDRTRAWRIGMRARRAARYRRWSYEWGTELDGLNSRYLSFARVVDDVPGYGKAAILRAAEGAADGGVLLTVSEMFEWESDADHVVAIRDVDGSLLGQYTAAPGDTAFEVIALDLDVAPTLDPTMEAPHVIFGTVERWSFPVLVTEVTPDGFESVNLTAMNYDERVYADDDGAPEDDA